MEYGYERCRICGYPLKDEISRMWGFGPSCRSRFFYSLKLVGIKFWELREMVFHDDPLISCYAQEAEKALYETRLFDAERFLESAELIRATL